MPPSAARPGHTEVAMPKLALDTGSQCGAGVASPSEAVTVGGSYLPPYVFLYFNRSE